MLEMTSLHVNTWPQTFYQWLCYSFLMSRCCSNLLETLFNSFTLKSFNIVNGHSVKAEFQIISQVKIEDKVNQDIRLYEFSFFFVLFWYSKASSKIFPSYSGTWKFSAWKFRSYHSICQVLRGKGERFSLLDIRERR